jgi:hypothetical protein
MDWKGRERPEVKQENQSEFFVSRSRAKPGTFPMQVKIVITEGRTSQETYT